ncbi:hypothetical protein FRX31_012708 [Thalictrum thalictroides]|uniref:F-box protein At3g26010-like beta-propeller domain-containing protein n=1 Tax=Thalictrum thalictroides TaxID=46969 RepID=A0A7J6WJZ6_THATH|nr:hypothetical protein FRX31_012708 [Thalictrum thalictroides]
MKCLSKGWCHSISHYRRSRTRSSNSTFVYQCKFQGEQNNQVLFLNAKEQVGGDTVVVETLEYHSIGYNNIQFVGSSNGLILCKSCYNSGDNTTLVPYVCNPILNQWVSVTPICVGEHSIFMGLVFDGVSQHHFKVVLCYASYVKMYRKRLNYHIYSSDTGEWREVKAKLVNSSMLTTSYMMFEGDISYLYRKGMVHWISNRYMLVYHFQNNFFKVIVLPAISIQRMWE